MPKRRTKPVKPSRFRYNPAEALAHLEAADPAVKELITRVGNFALELHEARSLFESLLRSIIYQQLHGKAAAAIHGRVLAVLTTHGGIIPEAIVITPDTALREAGLSGAKLLAIRDLAAKCLAGTVPSLAEAHQLTDDELVERLTTVRGIGPWTVHMLLIFQLGRPDVMPTGDFAIRLAFKKLYRKRKDPLPAQIIRHAVRWQPYRSVVSWYLWRSLDPAGGT